jgi:hypothetical protein
MERILSPQGIHALLGIGGGLFVIGLITWLATKGIFDHPLVLAAALGAGNLLILGAGFWLVLNTRYQLAGLALTLLACLVMPLHLWFYHAQKLLTFDNHLWAAALVISLLYALTARVLKNFWFVPVFLGGVALTCLLILADLHQFWQITAPAITLCVLGIIAIHSERLFTLDEQSPFRRDRFGLAFFWSGHGLLALGLLGVLVAQLAGGPLYASLTKPIYEQWGMTPTELVTTTSGKLIALLLVLAGVYAHLYSDLVVRRKGYYLQIAAVLVLWIEFIVLDYFNIKLEKETLLGVLAGTGLVLHLFHRWTSNTMAGALRILPFLSILFCLGATIGGVLLYFGESFRFFPISQQATSLVSSPMALLISMIIALLANGIGYATSQPDQRSANIYLGSTSLTALLVPALALAMWGPQSWFGQMWLILALAIIAVVVAWRYPLADYLGKLSHILVAFWLLLGLPHFVTLGGPDALSLIAILATATGYYLLTTILLAQRAAIPGAVVCAILALIHLFGWFDFALAYKMAAGAIAGAIFTALGLAFPRLQHRNQQVGKFLLNTGHLIFFISLLATMLLGIQTLLGSRVIDHTVWSVFNALVLEAVLALVFYWLRAREPVQKLYLAFVIGNVVLAMLLMVTLLNLPFWRKAELASVGLGIGLTVLGFLAWAKEEYGQQRQDAVTPMFLLGTLLVGVPLVLVVMGYRSKGEFEWSDEVAMFIIGIVLLAAGCICQVRIPAIGGAVLTVLYLLGLLLFVPWSHLGTAALVLAGGGAAIFLLGLALSIFRDKILALPVRVKERKGIFQVLGWR